MDDIQGACVTLKERGVELRDQPRLVARIPDHEVWMTLSGDGEGNRLALMHEKR